MDRLEFLTKKVRAESVQKSFGGSCFSGPLSSSSVSCALWVVALINFRLLSPSPGVQADAEVFQAFRTTNNLISVHKLTALRDLLYYAEVPFTRSRSRVLPMPSAPLNHAKSVHSSFLYWRDAPHRDAPFRDVSLHGFDAAGAPVKGSDEDIEAWGLHQATCNCTLKADGVMCGEVPSWSPGPLPARLQVYTHAFVLFFFCPSVFPFFLSRDARCRQAINLWNSQVHGGLRDWERKSLGGSGAGWF